MKIREYNSEQLREFARMITEVYKKNETLMFTFEDWKRNTFSILAKRERLEEQFPKEIRIAPSTEKIVKIINDNRNRISEIDNLPEGERALAKLKLFREIIQPEKIIKLEEPIRDPGSGTPMWFGSTLNSADLYMGYKNGDSSDPFCIKLADPEPGIATVHAKMSGGTGSGKSVTMHTLIANILYYYPPWEVTLYLADFKKVELSKYNSPIKTPHVKVVAASENMTFVQSVMEAYDQEMARRQVIFTEVGCEKLSDFRKKYNMIMPRCLLLVDEFGQVKSNLKKAEALGSSTTGEEKAANDRVLHRIGTLGRSMGMHMLISSQSLVGAFQDETDKQFGGGIALKVNDPSDSKSVIGNDASAYIRGKGKGYVNLNKAAGDPKDNILVRIPYIDSELSEKDLESGRQTYLTETVGMLKKTADNLGIPTDLFYYSDDALESFKSFETDVQDAIYRSENSPVEVVDEKTQIEKEVFLSQNVMSFALGREVTYSSNSQAFLDLKLAQNSNILVSGNNFDTYALRLLAGNIGKYMEHGMNIENYVVNCNLAVFKFSGIEDLIGLNNPSMKSTLISGSTIPMNGYRKLNGRKQVYLISEKLKENMSLNGKTIDDYFTNGEMVGLGFWDSSVAMKVILEDIDRVDRLTGYTAEQITQMAPLVDGFIEDMSIFQDLDKFIALVEREGLSDLLLTEKDGQKECTKDVTALLDIIGQCVRAFHNIYNITGMRRFVEISDFSYIFTWIIGAEGLDEVTSNMSDEINKFKYVTMVGPKYGIFTVLCASNWNKAYKLVENFNYVIEKEDKAFFSVIGMQKFINIYEHTFQVHDKENSIRKLIKEYKLD